MKTTRKLLAIFFSIMFIFSAFAAGNTAMAADVQDEVYAAQDDTATDEGTSDEWTVGDWIAALIDMVNLGSIWETVKASFATIAPMIQAFIANVINFFTGAKA